MGTRSFASHARPKKKQTNQEQQKKHERGADFQIYQVVGSCGGLNRVKCEPRCPSKRGPSKKKSTKSFENPCLDGCLGSLKVGVRRRQLQRGVSEKSSFWATFRLIASREKPRVFCLSTNLTPEPHNGDFGALSNSDTKMNPCKSRSKSGTQGLESH